MFGRSFVRIWRGSVGGRVVVLGLQAIGCRRGGKVSGGIDGFRTEDFEVVGYKPMGKIEMKMSVSQVACRRGEGCLADGQA